VVGIIPWIFVSQRCVEGLFFWVHLAVSQVPLYIYIYLYTYIYINEKKIYLDLRLAEVRRGPLLLGPPRRVAGSPLLPKVNRGSTFALRRPHSRISTRGEKRSQFTCCFKNATVQTTILYCHGRDWSRSPSNSKTS